MRRFVFRARSQTGAKAIQPLKHVRRISSRRDTQSYGDYDQNADVDRQNRAITRRVSSRAEWEGEEKRQDREA